MKTLIVSYSLTGNNEALAAAIARRLGAERARIATVRPMNTGAIALDMLLGRAPRLTAAPPDAAAYDLVVFVGPVWMGAAASPLRSWFAQLAPRLGRYAFASISGGAGGANPKLEADLTRRLGRAPEVVVDLHIADLLPREPRPTRDQTSAYRVTEADLDRLAEAAATALAKVATKR